MNREFIRSRRRPVHFAAFALIWALTGCTNSDSGTFSASASEKAAAEKGGLKPGGPANDPSKVAKPGRPRSRTTSSPVAKP